MSLTRSVSDNTLYFDPEIELTIHASHREQRYRRVNQHNLDNMAEPERRMLGDFTMPNI